ncbi:MAG: hypothetical protein K0R19_2588 [Bacillota bacterium]|jgi:L-ascorbate metabolism protein UlaG (beta-lactamase superfamily)|nr:hypothetical protein [Bacillota bacterium]
MREHHHQQQNTEITKCESNQNWAHSERHEADNNGTAYVSNRLTYVANAGVLLNLQGKKILIDGLCREGFDLYPPTPGKIAEDIVSGVPPYDEIDLMLFTHHHGDHFDPELVAKYVRNGGTATIVSTEKAIAAIRERLQTEQEAADPDLQPERVAAVDLQPERVVADHDLQPEWEGQLISLDLGPGDRKVLNLSGIEVEAISMTHFGKEYETVRNLAFLIKGNLQILHVGDGAAEPENYEGMQFGAEDLDHMIVPFPYVSLPASRKLVEEWVRPKRIIALHLPQKEKDVYGWIASAKKSAARAEQSFPAVTFLEVFGEEYKL